MMWFDAACGIFAIIVMAVIAFLCDDGATSDDI